MLFLFLTYLEDIEHLKTLTPRTNAYGSIFYTIVSLHGVHVVIGLLMLCWVLFLRRWEPAQYSPHRPYHNACDVLAFRRYGLGVRRRHSVCNTAPAQPGMTKQIQTREPESISPRRLWFGFAGGAVAWVLAGLLNVVLAWEACVSDSGGSFFFTQTGVHVVLGAVTLIMLALAVAAGVSPTKTGDGYRNEDVSLRPKPEAARNSWESWEFLSVPVSASASCGSSFRFTSFVFV